ncbi:TPA: hypothetical protein ACH3X3_005304 [Trebouxia sp. C0006]
MEREALHKAAIKFSLDLHPSATADVMEGVRDQLNAVLLRYSTYLEGVLISYTQPRILSQQARIHPYFPYFHVDVLADCVLFKPAAGHILDGKVHMVSHDFIGLLVLGLFNVSIGRQHIRADLNYDAIGDCWQSLRHEDHHIAVGTALRFKVDKVDDESEFFTLAGSLLVPGTGDVAYLSQQAKMTNKKRRHSEAAATDAPAAAAAAAPAGAATAAAAAKTPAAAVRTPSASAQAAKPSAAKAAATNVSAIKADKKAAKAAAKADAKAAAKAADKEHAKTAATAAAAAPNTGDDAHALSPKKKKRRKHQDTPSQAGPSTEAPAAPASNAQHRTAANSPAVNGLTHGAAAQSPAVAQAAAISTPIADQNAANGPTAQQPAAVTQNGVADSHQDGKKVKQKAHKKKKREIDKPAASPVTASAHPEPSLAISQDAVPNTSVAAAPSEPGSLPSGSSKKHKKHKEKTGSKLR